MEISENAARTLRALAGLGSAEDGEPDFPAGIAELAAHGYVWRHTEEEVGEQHAGYYLTELAKAWMSGEATDEHVSPEGLEAAIRDLPTVTQASVRVDPEDNERLIVIVVGWEPQEVYDLLQDAVPKDRYNLVFQRAALHSQFFKRLYTLLGWEFPT